MFNNFGIFAEIEEQSRLENLEKKLQSARIKNVDYCIQCGFCCHRRTCVPTPDELIKVAEYMKLDVKDLINKYYAIDRHTGSNTYIAKPVGENIKDLAGQFIPSERTFNEGKCIFLDENNNCKIYSVRPESAKKAGCWIKNKIVYNPIKFWENNMLLKRFGINGQLMEDSIYTE
jgi:Fe-S-cluster containining protein